MRVYVKAPTNMSRAMFRVANALERYAPAGVEIVQDQASADLSVHHVIGLDAVGYRTSQPCAVIQYCVNSATKEGSAPWHPLWARAKTVWSYYDLAPMMPDGATFYYAPMGLDPVFRGAARQAFKPRDFGVLTSGYVNGHGQEAIEEPIVAAELIGLSSVHLGPMPTGLTRNVTVNVLHDISDASLVRLYEQCKWVMGLRFVEGFEMPAIEGLACGARPVVFDRPEMRHWYGDHAVYVPECHGDLLIQHLWEVFSTPPVPVSADEHAAVLSAFNWRTITAGFWERVMA